MRLSMAAFELWRLGYDGQFYEFRIGGCYFKVAVESAGERMVGGRDWGGAL